MSKLQDIGNRFKGRFEFVNGAKFWGQLLAVPPTIRINEFIVARRLLRVGSNSRVKPGDVVICEGVTYIVAQHGEGSRGAPLYKHFKLFEVSEKLEWNQQNITADPVTGVDKVTRDASQGDVYLSLQTAPSVTDRLGVDQMTMSCVCNKEIAVDDAVGQFIVMKAYQIFGVTVAHLRIP